MLIPSIHERKPWLSFILVFVVGLNLYFNFSFPGNISDRAGWLDQTFGQLVLPLQYSVSSLRRSLTDSASYLKRLTVAERQNRELRSELSRQRLETQRLKELELENDRLRELLRFKEKQPLNYLAGEVIGKDPSGFFYSFLIDRGSEDSVEVNMPVVSTQGVVGRIFEVSPWASRVLLVSDPNSRVDAVVQRSRTRAIVAGVEGERLGLKFLPRRQDITVGDVLVTSGLDGIFPSGFQIGKIVEIERDPHQVLEQAEVIPSVDFDSVEEVFIILDLESIDARVQADD